MYEVVQGNVSEGIRVVEAAIIKAEPEVNPALALAIAIMIVNTVSYLAVHPLAQITSGSKIESLLGGAALLEEIIVKMTGSANNDTLNRLHKIGADALYADFTKRNPKRPGESLPEWLTGVRELYDGERWTAVATSEEVAARLAREKEEDARPRGYAVPGVVGEA